MMKVDLLIIYLYIYIYYIFDKQLTTNLFLKKTFLFFQYENRMLYFFLFVFFLFRQSTNIEKRVQIQPILYSFPPIRLQIFFPVSNKKLINELIN